MSGLVSRRACADTWAHGLCASRVHASRVAYVCTCSRRACTYGRWRVPTRGRARVRLRPPGCLRGHASAYAPYGLNSADFNFWKRRPALCRRHRKRTAFLFKGAAEKPGLNKLRSTFMGPGIKCATQVQAAGPTRRRTRLPSPNPPPRIVQMGSVDGVGSSDGGC